MNTAVKAVLTFTAATVLAHAAANHAGNAALRYWAAFSELRDSALTAQQAKEISAVLDGTAPYEQNKYEELIQKNHLALEVMSRGTLLKRCDWGLDYDLGADMPVEYAREALTLGRLNVLYTLQSMNGGNIEGGVQALVSGLRFSHDVGNGGSLFATVVAKSLLIDHLRLIVEVLRQRQLNLDQRLRLQPALAASSLELDWSSAAKRDMELLRRQYAQTPETAAALDRIAKTYVAAVNEDSGRFSAELVLKTAPKELANVVPNLGGVLKAKQDLSDAIRQARTALQ